MTTETIEERPPQCARCNYGKRVEPQSEFFTPIEFVEQKLGERIGKDIVVWHKGKWGEEPVDVVIKRLHDCALHFYACSGDRSLVANVGKYELCLRVEKIDYAVWRQRLHDEVDALKDDELYRELVGGW